MVNIHYQIDSEFRCHESVSNLTVIGIGGHGYDKLKDSEKDIFINDCITHEFIHALLEDIFNLTTSELYEFIGDSLLNTVVLKRAVCLTPGDRLWSDCISQRGNSHVYDTYSIDNIDLIQAYLICNRR